MRLRRRAAPLVLALAAVAVALAVPRDAAAQRAAPGPAPNAAIEADHYQRCMEEARRDPGNALENARLWGSHGGGHPAEHCAAVSLIGLKRYAEAGKRLDALGDAMVKSPGALRAEVLGQAGQAWLLAGNPQKAESSLTSALAILPGDPDLLTDRAAAFGAEKRWADAVHDLDEALAREPGRPDALLFRASARRALGQLQPALADAEAALRAVPDSPEALLERGNIRHLLGNDAGARQDWQRTAQLGEGSEAGRDARINLARLDGAPEPQPQPAAPAKKPTQKKPAQKP